MSDEEQADPAALRSERFAHLPEPIGPQDWVTTQDAEPPWSIYTAPDVDEEQIRRWAGFG